MALALGICFVIKVLLPGDNMPAFFYEQEDDSYTNSTGLSTGLFAQSLLDTATINPVNGSRQPGIKLHNKQIRSDIDLICRTDLSGSSANISSAVNGVTVPAAVNSYFENKVTVEHHKWHTGEEMIIKSFDEVTEVSFNTANTTVLNQSAATAVGTVTAYDGENSQTLWSGRHISSTTTSPSLFSKSPLCSVSAPSCRQVAATQVAAVINTPGSDDTAGSNITTAIGAVMMSPFNQDHHCLASLVVSIDAEDKMAVIEAEDKSDNTHVLIITSNVPESSHPHAQELYCGKSSC